MLTVKPAGGGCVIQYNIIVIDTNYTLINDLMIHLMNHQLYTHWRGGKR